MDSTLRDALLAAESALIASSVFVTPLERLKGWNEYKEDAAKQRNEALAAIRKALESP